MKLLTRDQFRETVMKRDHNCCILCFSKNELTVHHIIDRNCFDNGGYYENNGVTLCPSCHIKAENGYISCKEIRKKAGIIEMVLPDGYNADKEYDKWGVAMKENEDLIKYPRTCHIEGSGIQKGDEDNEITSFSDLRDKNLTVEEKIDGANTGLSFNIDCELMLQCRGHYLLGRGDWPEFDQFKVWSNTWKDDFFDVISNRYIVYGEWMSAFHSVYYDLLPHFFMEFDIYDKENEVFLDTKRRHEMLSKLPVKIESVRVIKEGKFKTMEDLLALVGRSPFVSDNACDSLESVMISKKIPEEDRKIILGLNKEKLMEGLYIKWEEDGIVKGRYKYVRPDFVQTILSYGKHWLERPSIPNKMRSDCDMFKIKE